MNTTSNKQELEQNEYEQRRANDKRRLPAKTKSVRVLTSRLNMLEFVAEQVGNPKNTERQETTCQSAKLEVEKIKAEITRLKNV
jgi:hypothetical protein